jgi:hypothetical protein
MGGDNNLPAEERMSNHRSFIFLFLLLFTLTGCSGIRVSQDHPDDTDYSALKTYAWQSENQEKTGDIRLDSPLRDARIRSAIDKYLSEKGYRRVQDAQPDVYVAYQQEIYNRIDADNGGSGFVFGMGSFGTHGGIGFSTGNRVADYDEAMLVIDIIDAGSGGLLWRGTATRNFSQHAEPEKVTKWINETVQKILDQFPPQEK